MSYNPLNLNGQATMANSQPVVISSNQSPVSIAGTVNIVGNPSVSGTVNVGNFPTNQNISGSVVGYQGTNPWIITGSVQASLTPAANQSVSGTVGSSIIGLTPVAVTNTPSVSGTVNVGNLPTTQNVSGSVVGFQGTSPWIITGSVQGSFTAAANQSVSGTVGASIIGLTPVAVTNTPSVSGTVNVGNLPTTQNVSGSVVGFQGTSPWIITGSIQGTAAANQSVSGTVNVGNLPTNQNVSGSVVAFQGTSPWIITGSVQGSFTAAANQSVSGTVGASIIGSVPTTQAGIWITSIVSTVPSSVLVGASIMGLTPVAVTNTPSVSGTVNIGNTVPVTLSGNPSISGTVLVGNFPTNQNVSGSVVAFQGTNPWVMTGSVQGSFSPSGNQSVSGSVNVGSILGVPAIVSTANSSTATLGSGATFTGTSEDVKDFAIIVISVFADQVSGTDGLSVQQSSNGTNWDITDTYTIPASTGKTFSFQPAARFLRVVYTNGATIQGAFRLQTIYHPLPTKNSSQRASDGYTNETDLEQVWGFNSYFNGTTWDRVRGTIVAGILINPGSSSILSLQTGTRNTSVIGSYNEDAGHTSGDIGLFTMGVRNDTMSSITSTDLDYSPHMVGPSGETIVANAPLTKWVAGVASAFTGIIQPVIAAQGSSVFTYITGFQAANASANNAYLTLYGATSSIIAYTVVPANGGSNIYYPNAIKTNANGAFSASLSGVASVFLSAQGFISKT